MIYKGKVTALHSRDPRTLIRVVVPQVTGTQSQTARLAALTSAPLPGDSVWVSYEAGDFSKPVVLAKSAESEEASP